MSVPATPPAVNTVPGEFSETPKPLAEAIADDIKQKRRDARLAALDKLEAALYTPAARRSLADTIADDIATADRQALEDATEWLDIEMSQLTHTDPPSVKCDTEPDEHRCTSPRWIGQYSEKLGRARTIPGRCWCCVECRLWHRALRLSRLLDGFSRWERVEVVRCTSRTEYRALTRQLERKRESTGLALPHVSIPYEDGARVVFTEAVLDGETLDTTPDVLQSTIEALLVGASTDKRARLDGSKNWEKRDAKRRRRKRERQWKKIGETKKNAAERANTFDRFGCKPVRQMLPGSKRSRSLEYDVSHLSKLELDQLWWSLGFIDNS